MTTTVKFQPLSAKRMFATDNFFPTVQHLFDDWTKEINKQTMVPSVNVSENDEKYSLSYLIPGFKKEEIKVSIEHEKLIVSGEQEKNEEPTNMQSNRREFEIINFKRSFKLNQNMNLELLSAKYENGILQIDIPKQKPKPEQHLKMIEVK